MGAYSTQTGHMFRRKLDSRSSANRTPVPFQTGHLFQTKLDTMGVTARGKRDVSTVIDFPIDHWLAGARALRYKSMIFRRSAGDTRHCSPSHSSE